MKTTIAAILVLCASSVHAQIYWHKTDGIYRGAFAKGADGNPVIGKVERVLPLPSGSLWINLDGGPTPPTDPPTDPPAPLGLVDLVDRLASRVSEPGARTAFHELYKGNTNLLEKRLQKDPTLNVAAEFDSTVALINSLRGFLATQGKREWIVAWKEIDAAIEKQPKTVATLRQVEAGLAKTMIPPAAMNEAGFDVWLKLITCIIGVLGNAEDETAMIEPVPDPISLSSTPMQDYLWLERRRRQGVQ